MADDEVRVMDRTQLVSIVIPVFNGERYVGEAIDSALRQTHQPVEVVVIDDGSTDRTASICDSFGHRLKYHRQANSGIARARNCGVDLSQGTYLAFLDSDDLYPPDRLAKLMRALRSRDAPDAVAGHARNFISPELAQELRGKIQCAPDPQPVHTTSGMLMSRRVFERVGPFSSRWDVGIDLEWMLRFQDTGLALLTIPDVVTLRRLHDRNNGLMKKQKASERAQILMEAIRRRRAHRA